MYASVLTTAHIHAQNLLYHSDAIACFLHVERRQSPDGYGKKDGIVTEQRWFHFFEGYVHDAGNAISVNVSCRAAWRHESPEITTHSLID